MSTLRILHLEDSQQDAELVEATLAGDGLDVEVVRVDTATGFRAALESGSFDLIFADYNLPMFDGMSAQIVAAQLRPDVPFIFLSGSIGEELAVERLKAGATDYVLKDRMARLPSAVRRALAEAAERAERRRAEEKVRRLNTELERRVIERTIALAESERRLKAILDHSPAAISLKDLNGRYILANRQFERFAGVVAAAIAGRSDRDLFVPELAADYRANDAQVVEKNTPLDFEETFLQPDGPHVLHSIKFPLLDSDALPYALCTISIDITERKKADDAIRIARLEAERANRAKTEFVSRMSHDLRTPLNAILGFGQLLELDDLNRDQRESVSQIRRGGEHLLILINEVLDIEKIETGHLALSPEPVDAVEIVQLAIELVRPLAAQRDIALVLDPPPTGDVLVVADRQRLNQVLLNLLSNAVKYNREGGTASVRFEPSDGRMRISVRDDGAGIAQEKLALLFQPFERLGAEQTAVEGTGLGLALSRGLAEAMGGTIGVESEVGRGSTFWIELAPAGSHAGPEPLAEESAQGAPSAPNTTGVVLYIEDNRTNLRLMQRILQLRPGVRLVHAFRGDDGLRLVREHHPDLVLLDLHLPDMSGEEVLRQISRDGVLRRIPVAILSADPASGTTALLKEFGAIVHLTKPLVVAHVLSVVDESLRGPARIGT
jgi:PAS domain S-box-containing protein